MDARRCVAMVVFLIGPVVAESPTNPIHDRQTVADSSQPRPCPETPHLFLPCKASASPSGCFTMTRITFGQNVRVISPVKPSFHRIWAIAQRVGPCFAVSSIHARPRIDPLFASSEPLIRRDSCFTANLAIHTTKFAPNRLLAHAFVEPLFSTKPTSFSTAPERLIELVFTSNAKSRICTFGYRGGVEPPPCSSSDSASSGTSLRTRRF